MLGLQYRHFRSVNVNEMSVTKVHRQLQLPSKVHLHLHVGGVPKTECGLWFSFLLIYTNVYRMKDVLAFDT